MDCETNLEKNGARKISFSSGSETDETRNSKRKIKKQKAPIKEKETRGQGRIPNKEGCDAGGNYDPY